jgi:hypothetical protein
MVLCEIVEVLFVSRAHTLQTRACAVCGVCTSSVASEAELIDDSGDRMYLVLVHAHAHGNDLLETGVPREHTLPAVSSRVRHGTCIVYAGDTSYLSPDCVVGLVACILANPKGRTHVCV